MKINVNQVYIKLAALLVLLLIAGCATKPGIKNREEMAIWIDKAAQAGCNNLSQVIDISTSHDATANAMTRIMRKLGVSGTAEEQLTTMLSDPSGTSVLVLSKINSHALDVVDNLIKQWKGAAPSAMLCVFAQEDRAESLRRLAQEKGFNLHITPLSVIYPEIESDKK